MTWGDSFESWWLPMAELLHYTRPDILALTLDQFVQAIEYVKGRAGNGG